ncbi:MAG: hypothetical protein WAU34_05240 [Desulfobacterales bacterium]|jgi:hypothetical protein
MDKHTVFPDKPIVDAGPMARTFINLDKMGFLEACRYVHDLPYGYNSDRDDLMILFKEKMGSCTTKHAVIATLAAELQLQIEKSIGIYAMTEELVTGTQHILEKYEVPYVPMVHCFLVYQGYRVDLSEGNRNGKNGPIDNFLYTEKVAANISGKDEYLLYRKALKDHILPREELYGKDLKTVLKAREEGLSLLRSKIKNERGVK